MSWVPPGAIVGLLVVLVLSQLLYALWPYARRAYLPVLALTAFGFLVGQGWDALGLPSLRLGEANLLPGIAFAVALQPLADRIPSLPLRFR
ncbi:MAG: hypothetical protein J2P45_11445 [Candidatus Dormibacteraeota bacterium]|nr:hypothetical protein [Candidatus Dormibacteraeota bacterium]